MRRANCCLGSIHCQGENIKMMEKFQAKQK